MIHTQTHTETHTKYLFKLKEKWEHLHGKMSVTGECNGATSLKYFL